MVEETTSIYTCKLNFPAYTAIRKGPWAVHSILSNRKPLKLIMTTTCLKLVNLYTWFNICENILAVPPKSVLYDKIPPSVLLPDVGDDLGKFKESRLYKA